MKLSSITLWANDEFYIWLNNSLKLMEEKTKIVLEKISSIKLDIRNNNFVDELEKITSNIIWIINEELNSITKDKLFLLIDILWLNSYYYNYNSNWNELESVIIMLSKQYDKHIE